MNRVRKTPGTLKIIDHSCLQVNKEFIEWQHRLIFIDNDAIVYSEMIFPLLDRTIDSITLCQL
jgi:hypothetical protein